MLRIFNAGRQGWGRQRSSRIRTSSPRPPTGQACGILLSFMHVASPGHPLTPVRLGLRMRLAAGPIKFHGDDELHDHITARASARSSPSEAFGTCSPNCALLESGLLLSKRVAGCGRTACLPYGTTAGHKTPRQMME